MPSQYSFVGQTEHPDVANEMDSNSSKSIRLANESPFQTISATHNSDVSKDVGVSGSETADARVGSIIRSIASTRSSYQMVDDDDDYDEAQGSPRIARQDPSNLPVMPLRVLNPDIVPESIASESNEINDNKAMKASDSLFSEPITRSLDSSVELQHPTPGLQSLQGAYKSNVERLERSAEELSINSNIGEEIRKLKQQQKLAESRRSSLNQHSLEDDNANSNARFQFSAASLSSSIIGVNSVARSGGFPQAVLMSPQGSINSISYSYSSHRGPMSNHLARVASLPEPEKEGKPLDSPLTVHSVPITAYNFSQTEMMSRPHGAQSDRCMETTFQKHGHGDVQNRPPAVSADMADRPATAASTDTYKQVSNLFKDFDGVHFSAAPRQPSPPNEDNLINMSHSQPALTRNSQAIIEAPPGENLVYYPAPVPVFLNLPQRLSKLPSVYERDRRRSHALNAISPENRKSAIWLGNDGNAARDAGKDFSDNRRSTRDLGNMPPQLRASAFFDQPGLRPEIKLTSDSPMATLDSILDASADAPVTAFTDHPFAGHVGSEVYGKEKTNTPASPPEKEQKAEKRLSSFNFLKGRRLSSVPVHAGKLRKRNSVDLLAESKKNKSSAETEEGAKDDDAAGVAQSTSLDNDLVDVELPDENAHDAAENEEGLEEEHLGDYLGAPTTLLAELQLRKQQQKQRNRTAANTFPNGMHSTLLELDAVAQVQKKARMQRQVHLAWEDPEAPNFGGNKIEDDEDVPLGVLFSGQRSMLNTNRPVGLMERRELEDNEPLSHRRARLRGERPEMSSNDSRNTMLMPEDIRIPDHQERDGDEEETLAQRKARLKIEADIPPRPATRAIDDDFASEVLSQLGTIGRFEKDAEKSDEKSDCNVDPEQETLGQRRKRLQAEREAQVQNDPSLVQKRRSMADILQAAPIQNPDQAFQRRNSTRPGLLNEIATSKTQQRAPGALASGPGLPGYTSFTGTDLVGYGSYGNGTAYCNPGMYNASMGQVTASKSTGNLKHLKHLQNSKSAMIKLGQPSLPPDSSRRDMIDRWRQSVV